ncbi:MAG TPA: hypothetical protein VH210_03760 [Gaiellaceae bacterium]|jgi:hypothetical protein|nr:hypothetical protein [Gaiellaceae bacterium]
MDITASSTSSERDFDFWTGTWQGRNRRLRERLAGCNEWDEFEGTCVARPVLDGLGNIEEFHTDYQGGIVGMALRFFDPVTRLWAIYWADTRRTGVLEQPVLGSFSDGVGVFECDDTFDGKPIIVRYVWSDITPDSARWAQSFSPDGGETWETNWTVGHSRVD